MNTKLVDQLVTDLTAFSYKLKNMPESETRHLLFHRYPHVRLTWLGEMLLRKSDILEYCEFPIKGITNGNKIKLYQNNNFPYYMGKTRFVIFDGEEALMAKLVGDINSWIEYNL